MLKIKNVNAGYEEEIIIKEINVSFKPNQITTLIGPNGCGKSTLLKTMTKAIQPKHGDIFLQEQNIKELSLINFAKQVAILPQIRNIPNTTVETLISHGRFPYLGFLKRLSNQDREIVDYAMEVTGVSNKRHHSLHELSGGERQKVYIAMTLAQNTDLIILDEPTTFLDINHQFEVLHLISDLKKKGKTFIMVLHDIQHALTYSDEIIVMNHGKIQKIGSPSSLMKSKIIDDVFDIQSKIFTEGDRSYYLFDKR